jgi:hypothetical protein
MKTRYRIVTDEYLGYEVQYKKWWWPFWVQVGYTGGLVNTWSTVESAERFARRHMQPDVVKEVV